jgi:hypothetical protein
LYGLKQSPRVWYQTIDKFFADMGFKRVEGDYGLYVIWNADVLTKALAGDKHDQHTDTLGVRHSKCSQSGSVESNAGCSL